jgi:nitrogen fixation/metabolism regulation signal transduction histidine kinase
MKRSPAKFFRNLELEWKILIGAAVLFLALGVPIQRSMAGHMESALRQGLDPGLEALLRQGYSLADSTGREVWLAGLEHNRQWQAMIPIIAQEQRRSALLVSGAAFLVIFAFTLWILKRLTRPLKDLAAAAETIGRGEERAAIAQTSGGALGRLETAMDHMQEELLTLRENLLSQGMEQAWRDIARVMAHEIKNPLTPIRLTLDRMEENIALGKAINAEELKKFATRIASQVEQLERLVGAFSSFAREPEVRLKAVGLGEAVVAAAEPMRDSLKVSVRGNAVVHADPYLLNQVVLNIVKNAAEAGATALSADISQTEGQALLRMTDNGPGVEREKLEKLFIPYVTYKPGGTGLGLPIVKRLVMAMGGSVRLESGSGRGLTVEIRFQKMNGEAS